MLPEGEKVMPPYDRNPSRAWATRMPTLRTIRHAIIASNMGFPRNDPSKILARCTVKMIREPRIDSVVAGDSRQRFAEGRHRSNPARPEAVELGRRPRNDQFAPCCSCSSSRCCRGWVLYLFRFPATGAGRGRSAIAADRAQFKRS